MTNSPAPRIDPDAKLADGSPAYFRSGAAYAAARINPETGQSFTRAAASKWNKEGLLAFVPDPLRDGKKLLDAAASDRARDEHQNPLKRLAPAPGAAESAASTDPVPGEAAASSAAPTEQPLSSDAADDNFSGDARPRRDQTQETVGRAKAHAAVIDVRLKELAYKEKLGQLVPVSEIRYRETARMGALRDSLVQLASLVAEEANPDDPGRARKAIMAGVNQVLNQHIAEARTELAEAASQALQAAEERAAERVAAHA
ncbi:MULTISPECIES: hypothetical protein [unclassified Oceanicaulis]|uniref:hypothetical protein n=1 Tax=unclassified Oceanicaulis TaxID=2632123 RepID=UPI0025E8CEEF|nr:MULTISPECIES: hypothetical protein [unclassified Oceanicaulis]